MLTVAKCLVSIETVTNHGDRHVIIKLDGEEIGHIMTLYDFYDCYHIEGFVIYDPKLRGKGYGSQALQLVIELCKKEKHNSIITLSCSAVRRPFYERNGFVVDNSKFCGMVCNL